MYSKPTLECYGTFRQITLVGWSSNADGATFLGAVHPTNCTIYDPSIGNGGAFVGCPITS